MSNDQLPSLQGGAGKDYKGNIKADRVVWMSRTSDVIGSHMKKDMESYLTLIRRKIQEKCATTQELITQIRKTKVGEGSFVTPNEFRYTLIKFGLIFPQSLVDRIFAVFDSDRSGTMDFDEFAMWIMNSEFRPVLNSESKCKLTPEEQLRLKLAAAIKDNNLFQALKKNVSYLDLISEVNRRQVKNFNEKDTRQLFQLFDSQNYGFIDKQKILRWATTGSVNTPPHSSREPQIPSLSKCVFNVCGPNSLLLQKCFSAIVSNNTNASPVLLGFDEFRRYLLTEGLGRNRLDAQVLFVALGGKLVQKKNGDDMDVIGYANVTYLLQNMPKSIVYGTTVDEADGGGGCSSHQRIPMTVEMISSRADRRLRDAVRKSYKLLKLEFEQPDGSNSGFIEANQLQEVINRNCLSISYQDFRVIVQQLKRDDNSRVCWQHFLHLYNPKKAPHILDGKSTIPEFQFVPNLNHNSSVEASAEPSRLSSKELSRAVSPTSNTNAGNGLTKANSVSFMQNMSSTDSGDVGNTSGVLDERCERNMRRVWQLVLRECQRNDPDRTGVVHRNIFINALEGAKDQAITSEAITKLANKYSSAETSGLVDYVSCFRNFLNDLGANMAIPRSNSLSAIASPSRPGTFGGNTTAMRGLKQTHPWEFDYRRDKSRDALPYWKNACVNPRDDYVAILNDPVHKRGRVLSAAQLLSTTFSTTSSGNTMNGSMTFTTAAPASVSVELKNRLLKQYDAKVLHICTKCFQTFAPYWREMKQEFKRAQSIPTSSKAEVLTPKFYAVMNQFDNKLTNGELGTIARAFRGKGMPEVVLYEDFLGLCKVMNGDNTPV